MSAEPVSVALPPHDEDAERALLGCLLMFPEDTLRGALSSRVACDDFYLRKHQVIWGAALKVRGSGAWPDVVAVKNCLTTDRRYEEAGGDEYLADLAMVAPATAANAGHYAKIVRTKADQRSLARLGYELGQFAHNGVLPIEAIQIASQRIELLRAEAQDTHVDSLFRSVDTLDASQNLVEWIVRGYAAVGATTILSGVPKGGKTTWVWGMLAALARGDSAFCGMALPCGPTKSVMLTENPRAVVIEKRERFKVPPGMVYALTMEDAFPRRPFSADMDAAMRVASKIGAKIIVVDTWRFWANFGTGDENDAGAVSLRYSEIQRAAAAGFCVIVIHHVRKSGGEEGTATAGSNALTGAANIVIELYRFGDKDGNQRVLKAWGHYDRIPAELVIELKEDGYAGIGEADAARDQLAMQRAIGAVEGAQKWVTIDEVKVATGMNRDVVLEALRGAFALGKIQRIGTGFRGSPFLHADLNLPKPGGQ